jgi:hypothetical protein
MNDTDGKSDLSSVQITATMVPAGAHSTVIATWWKTFPIDRK